MGASKSKSFHDVPYMAAVFVIYGASRYLVGSLLRDKAIAFNIPLQEFAWSKKRVLSAVDTIQAITRDVAARYNSQVIITHYIVDWEEVATSSDPNSVYHFPEAVFSPNQISIHAETMDESTCLHAEYYLERIFCVKKKDI